MAGRKKKTYSAIRAPRGRYVHIISLTESTRTACGVRLDDSPWVVCLARVNCTGCKLAVSKDCRPRGRRR